jgi:phosphatidylinositol 4-phosphatase
MDCLDRTNVVQGIFSRSALFAQLSPALPLSMKTAFRKNPLTLPWKTGEVAHRHLWADNADAISRLYSGTAALKRDFTRTGKRTKKGALDDGMNSLQRCKCIIIIACVNLSIFKTVRSRIKFLVPFLHSRLSE